MTIGKRELLSKIIKDLLPFGASASPDSLNDKLIIEICNYMLQGNLVVRFGHIPKDFTYEDNLKFSPATLNWNMQQGINTTMCQLFLHSLEPVKFLALGYTISQNENYIHLASEIFKSWIKFKDSNTDNKFVWYDHCVSNRVLYILFLKLTIDKSDTYFNESDINLFISQHAKFLYEDENYTPQNHGVMMDRSLYLISQVFDSFSEKDNWKRKALNRLQEAFHRDFTKNGVNLENSSEYQVFNFDLFMNLEYGILNKLGDSLSSQITETVNNSVNYMIHMSKPDLTLPLLGDGSKVNLKKMEALPSFKYINNSEELKYILSMSKNGTAPKKLLQAYPQEGYAFMRTTWDYNNDNSTYLSFISGYSLKNHKHGDDLSFTLFSKGKDIFVDPGTYTYQAGDFRRYFMSSLAHNTIVVNDKTYLFIQGDPSNTGILDYGEREGYFFVVGRNDMYEGINLTRTIIFLKSGNIIIFDDIKSRNKNKYSQIFHLSHKLKLEELRTFENTTEIIEEDLIIKIEQMKESRLSVHLGNKERAHYGIVSEAFNHIAESSSLEYSQDAISTQFITVISINKKNEIENLKIENNGDSLVVYENAKSFEVKLKIFPREFQGVYLLEKDLSNNNFSFTIQGAPKNTEFAWYIFKNGERIDIIWYNDSSTLNYQFVESGEYEIHYFIRDKVNQDAKKMYKYENKIII